MKKTQNRFLIPPLGVRGLLYVLLLVFASCKSCKKEINLLPDETQTGANTFGCLVDGKAWIPNGGSGFGASKPVSGGYSNPLPNVWIRTYKDNETIIFYIRNVNRVGTYPLNFDTQPRPGNLDPQNYGEVAMRSYASGDDSYITTKIYTGSVEITKADPANLLLSGRFSFTGVSSTGKTIKVTDGRFDINQKTQ